MKIGYFYNVSAKAANVDYEGFLSIVNAQSVKQLCDEVAHGSKDTKRRLPAFTWQATFADGCSRSNSHAKPTGLFILDIDHIKGDVREYYNTLYANHTELFDKRIPVVHITPSTHGLRLVCICDASLATIQEQQCVMARRLGIDIDEVTKDFARLSFVVPIDYFLKLDSSIFLNDFSNLIKNPDYEENISSNSVSGTSSSAQSDCEKSEAREDTTGLSSRPNEDNQAQDVAGGVALRADFKGIAYKEIVNQLVVQSGGVPQEGERNVRLYNICRKLRYICDFNTAQIFAICPRFGLSESEVRSVVESANKGNRTGKIPYDLYKIIQSLGDVENLEAETDEAVTESGVSALPKLPTLFANFAETAPEDFRPAVVCALLPVVGTLCSRLRAEYLDGEIHAPNFQTVIEAPQASGKSFTRKLVNTCMKPVILHDAQERVKEQAYIEACRQSKNAKKQPEEPQTLIRIIPASVSIAKLLKRLTQSQGLHLFSFLEELDTLTKTNKAGAWSQKSDIYRNAYDNAYYGQDYMSENSFSALVQVYYNLLLCGTPNAVGRFYDDPEDGLVSRVLFAKLPSQFGAELPRFRKMNNLKEKQVERICNDLNNSLCVKSDDTICPEHEMEMEWLNRAISRWLEKQRIAALKENNYARDIFRRRCAVNGFRAGMIAFYLEGEKSDTKTRKLVCDFALWLADYSLRNLLEKFGAKLNDQSVPESSNGITHKSIYDELPDVFTKNDLYIVLAKFKVKTPLKNVVYAWNKAGLIEKSSKGYKKISQ